MGLPSPPINFDASIDNVYNAHVKVIKEHLAEAREEARKAAIVKLDIDTNDTTTIVDILVSCDETWSKHGHTANNGVGLAISTDTGKVLDIQVQSKYYH